MSSNPSTPILQRRGVESESGSTTTANSINRFSRIPISLSPIPFRRTNSMRLRANSSSLYSNNNTTLNETTLKQHNKNLQQQVKNSAIYSDRVQQLRLINIQRARRGSLSMDEPKYEGSGDPGGTDSKNVSVVVDMKHMNGDLTRKNDRGMVSWNFYKIRN